MPAKPKTLQQAIVYFADPDNCLNFLVERRWPYGVECPTCGSKDVRFISTRRMWECKTKHPKRQFSVKVGTIFEDSALPLDKWLTAIWMIANCENGVSSYEVARALGITQKSAWFMLHRIRLAMQSVSDGKIGGSGKEVEADETYIGAAARFMHADRKKRMIDGKTGRVGKAAVMGLLERHGEIRTYVLPICIRLLCKGMFARTLHLIPNCSPMQLADTPDSMRITLTRSMTTRKHVPKGTSTLTESKTSGVSLSAD